MVKVWYMTEDSKAIKVLNVKANDSSEYMNLFREMIGCNYLEQHCCSIGDVEYAIVMNEEGVFEDKVLNITASKLFKHLLLNTRGYVTGKFIIYSYYYKTEEDYEEGEITLRDMDITVEKFIEIFNETQKMKIENQKRLFSKADNIIYL